VPLIACDLALVKSGTSTLETMLLRRPMVVTYRLGFWTFLIANALLKTPLHRYSQYFGETPVGAGAGATGGDT
jgi:lipid A disaccharide synthetase